MDMNPIYNQIDRMNLKQLTKAASRSGARRMNSMSKHIVKMAHKSKVNLVANVLANKIPGIAYNEMHRMFYAHEKELEKMNYNTADWETDKTIVIKDKRNSESSKHGYLETFIAAKSEEMKAAIDKGTIASEKEILATLDIQVIDIESIKTMAFDSGLSIMFHYKDKIGATNGAVFDFGDLNLSQEKELVDEYIKYFEGTDKICFIMSHHHHDHYSFIALPAFAKWVKTKKSTLITYRPLDSMIVARHANIFGKVLIVPYKSMKYQVGQYVLETFPENKNINATSMTLIKKGECAITGDQLYENVSQTSNLQFFQVPHHGSDHNGNYKVVKNIKINYVPNGMHWNLPKKAVVNHMKENNSVLINPVETKKKENMFGMK